VALAIETREVNGVTLLDLSGRITLGEGSFQLRDAVRALVAKGAKKILLNLSEVNQIDSAGLGEMVSAFTLTRSENGELKLLNVPKRVHDLLDATKLASVFDIQDDEARAVASFK
jgi:anti-sigma B factor antagonist